jgi:amino acid transporter
MFLYAFFHYNHPILESTRHSFSQKGFTALSMGLFTVMWNYLGWDSASTIAEEVEHPRKSYLSSIFTALCIIVVIYVISLMTSQRAGMNPGVLQSDGFPSLGRFIGGWWLGALISLGGIASAVGLFISNLLAITRVPEAIADDGLLPKFLSKIHPRFNTPHFSIILCATAVSGMVLWNFADLLIIDVTLYSSALLPEFIALIVLRYKQPLTPRSFKIPFNIPGLIALTILPTLCIVCAMSGLLSFQNSFQTAMWFALGAILTGPFTWRMIQWAKGKSFFQTWKNK